VNFFRVATQLAFDVESTLAAKKELEEKRAEDPQISAGKSSAASKPAIIGTYRSGSSTDLAPQAEKKNEHEAASDSEEERKRRGGGEAAPVVAKEENEWVKAWSRIVALVDLPDKSEEDSATAVEQTGLAEQSKAVQKAVAASGAAGKREREGLRERGFKKGLELGINSINKVSKANFKGIHAGGNMRSTPALASIVTFCNCSCTHCVVLVLWWCSQGGRFVFVHSPGLWHPDVSRGRSRLCAHILGASSPAPAVVPLFSPLGVLFSFVLFFFFFDQIKIKIKTKTKFWLPLLRFLCNSTYRKRSCPLPKDRPAPCPLARHQVTAPTKLTKQKKKKKKKITCTVATSGG
jgi:hypothetical protein